MILKQCHFETNRLAVKQWHSIAYAKQQDESLAEVVSAMLTTAVTQSLPDPWRGVYTVQRAQEWIADRDLEEVVLLVVEQASRLPVGLMILYESDELKTGCTIRLGYLLSEPVWGQGLATELVAGFVDWCRSAEVALLIGGVEPDNIASQRVLEKNGFVKQAAIDDEAELFFELQLRH